MPSQPVIPTARERSPLPRQSEPSHGSTELAKGRYQRHSNTGSEGADHRRALSPDWRSLIQVVKIADT